jgi:uncharacterized protein (TIGR00266 family)
MQFEIRNKPDYASLHLSLANGDKVVTESGVMMAMDPRIKLETNMTGGLLGAAKRALGGESLFLNTYTATGDDQRLDIAPKMPGDLEHVALGAQAVMCHSGAYCASTTGVNIDSKWAGAKSFFAGEGLVMLRCSGQGELWMASYGAIHLVDVQGSYTVDTGNVVAFDESLTFRVRSIGTVKSLLFSSEGMVCEFSGTGRLWYQTRSAHSLAAFLHPFQRVKRTKAG